MHTILLTGATGFLGRACLGLLRGRRAAVHVSARREAVLPAGVQRHAVDLLDQSAVADLVRSVRPSHLLHLAWETTPGTYWTSPANHQWLEASWRLVREFAQNGGQRVVVAGSCAEYDWTGSGVCREGTTPIRPTTLYGSCKAALWSRMQQLASRTGLSSAWGRLFFLYGPGEHPRRLVPSVIHSLFAGAEVACTQGLQERDFLHALDAADALVTLLESDCQGPFNIGSGHAVSIRSVVERITDLCGGAGTLRFGAVPRGVGDPDVLVANVERLQKLLGWRPRFTLNDGLADTIAWWRANAQQRAA
jgi:nucleoside-diphosphate-sugar epimerase